MENDRFFDFFKKLAHAMGRILLDKLEFFGEADAVAAEESHDQEFMARGTAVKQQRANQSPENSISGGEPKENRYRSGKIENEKDAQGKEVLVIPVQTPKPSKLEQCWEPGPPANSKFTPAEKAKIKPAPAKK